MMAPLPYAVRARHRSSVRVSAELIFVLAQLALQDCAMLGLPMHHYAISATVMRTRRPVGHIPLRQSPARPI